MAEERSGRLYGRKWKVTIYKKAYKTIKSDDGSSSITTEDTEHSIAVDVSLLRCVFKVEETYETHVAVCTLEVYNMNATAEDGIIKEGFQVSIEGGYDEGQYGEIFTGDIVQIIRNREDGVDYKLEILALRGSADLVLNFTKCSIAAGSTPRDGINTLSKNAKQAIAIGEISDNLSKQSLPRGKVLFGTPSKYLRDLAIDNDAYCWVGNDGKLVVKKVADEIPAENVLTLSPGNPNADVPATGLVGTPQYSDDGIHIKMLLDCRVKLFSLVKIDNEWIRRSLLSLNIGGGNNKLVQQNQFDKDGEYLVSKLVHQGDTWGDVWTTEVIGIGRNGKLLTSQETANDYSRG
ncbi:hypothetical protein [Sporomusa aerivorans]|uniref:hypothetical protein n=1 Tax=Sporomusa aerivorans TaxID=204936 RepID=UPI00352BABEC